MSREQIIHEAAMEVLAEVGVQIHSQKAIDIYKSNGIRVEDNIAFFTEDQVWEWINKAPEQFTIYARNPKYDVYMGDGTTNPAPAYGCAFIDDWEGNRRTGTVEDYLKALKIVEEGEMYKINGGIIIQPADVPEAASALSMFYAILLHSEKAIMVPTGYKEEMEMMMEMSYEVFGGKEAFREKARMITLINTVSPLQLDERMLDCLMIMAENGQPVILCPAAMLGATGSVTMAGTLVTGAAEVLAGLILAQMINPGTPVVYGVQSTAADMKGNITFACAAPEGTIMQGFAANMGKFYKVPSRGGGCQTDAPVINCQAGYESMLTFSSAYRHGISITMEAGGVMDSVNSTCFEKMIIDQEILRQVIFSFTPFDVDEEALNLEDIKEVAHNGSYLTSDSTLDNYDILYEPHIGGRNAKGSEYFKESIDKEMDRLIKSYDSHPPKIDPELKAKLREILSKSELSEEDLDRIEAE